MGSQVQPATSAVVRREREKAAIIKVQKKNGVEVMVAGCCKLLRVTARCRVESLWYFITTREGVWGSVFTAC